MKYNLPITNNKALLQNVTNVEPIIKCINNQNTQLKIHSIINSKLNYLLNVDNKIIKDIKKTKTAKAIKQKVDENKAIITKGDKGNTVVLLNWNDYVYKAYEFINSNI